MVGSIRSRIKKIRPFYGLDGTHSRSRYNLTLLIAVGIDAEEHVLPLAWALVPGEDETWWTWFCKRFKEATKVDLLPRYVVISDRDKGLLKAVEIELPGASYAMCCQHIAENIHKRFGREYKAPFGRSLARRRRLTSITRLKLYREPLLRLKNIYPQLATTPLPSPAFPSPAFPSLDLAMTLLISWNQRTRSGVRYESFLLFS
jgi:transposase-like protein